ncbi:hypothetical protein ACLFMI_12525 [Pseudonocardia nantongensis]|uniref:hypothetical protein n=1 Tax=Pseudonocardia nantongensis TaxID=1181885 RepID=UPI003979F6CC
MDDATGGTAAAAGQPAPEALAELVADAVAAHPSVARLHGGTFGAVATWLPGRRLVGVHVGGPGEPVEIGVVLRLDRPIPATVASLRRTLSPLVGGCAVDVTVADVDTGYDTAGRDTAGHDTAGRDTVPAGP